MHVARYVLPNEIDKLSCIEKVIRNLKIHQNGSYNYNSITYNYS